MNKLISRTFMVMLMLMVAMVLILGGMGNGPIPISAELAKEKRVTLSGVNLSTSTGNATGAQTGVNVSESWGYADKYTCFSFITNSTGTSMANSGTWALEGSYDNSFYNSITNTTIAASEVDLATSSNFGTAKYFRVNVEAIENSASYVNVQCIFQ